MKKSITTIFVAASVAAISQTNWKLDASHSKLGFSVTHMMVSEVEGKFKLYEGTVSSKSDIDFTDAKINFSADAASINTENDKRDEHLKSPDFFDVAKFQKITFEATSMKPLAKVKTEYDLEGNLTMHGVTKKIKLKAIGAPNVIKDPYGNFKYGFKVKGKINRKDFGLKWNAALEAGGMVVSEEVTLDINIELNKA
ncbi:MAG: YceI family protein [Bacteroidetes bacterium]|nr:YceI family protein [Bacteroidota bacterium]